MSHTSTIHLSESPNIFGLLSRAAWPKKASGEIKIPELSVDLKGIKPETALLRRYSRVCGFESKAHLPAAFPHIMAFPLHMKLLTDKRFPLPLLGLVHYKNSITQHRPLNINELFDIECTLSNSHHTELGIKFDIVSKVSAAGKVAWEETSTFLSRVEKKPAKQKKNRTALPSYQNNETWKLSAKLGRQYAKVSNDFNLIHLYSWSAKLFGFNHAIIHGMWSKNRCIAALSDTLGERPFKVDVDFKLPVYLPGTVKFNWQQNNDVIDFQLLDKGLTKPHLKGKVTLL
ncbi:MaoC/PaaZ C-terminal domain-containing protein [Alkalimarinus coralli]|uniref:MaoC/PaaZ C-terminal domain-containing protein n=1 Tax=Alkalimarinus coralli TaxID=2935863 RepID=UPI00202AEBF2|nr:MaoC/PaaZ C-terminal domain-containing protein [Alkalimarinus coralli]